MIELHGKRYMETKEASSMWSMTSKKIAELCPEIKDAIKPKKIWYIPVDARKPLSATEKQQLLLLTLQLKNDNSQRLDFSSLPFDISKIRVVYEDLAYGKYIYPFQIENPSEIPYKVILTEKGLKTALRNQAKQGTDFIGLNSLKLGVELLIALHNLYTQCSTQL